MSQICLFPSLHDELSDLCGPREGNLVNVHVVGDGPACGLPEPVHDVDDAFGEAGLLGKLSHVQRAEWSQLGRLEHDRAAGG
jgi:hypothetical protein